MIVLLRLSRLDAVSPAGLGFESWTGSALSGALSAPSDREAILRMLVRIKQPEAVNLHPEEAGASGVLAGAVARVAGAVRYAAGAVAGAG